VTLQGGKHTAVLASGAAGLVEVMVAIDAEIAEPITRAQAFAALYQYFAAGSHH
jgi:hypothetical protein